MQQILLFFFVLRAVMACAPSGKGVQFTDSSNRRPAKCNPIDITLTPATSPATQITPVAMGYKKSNGAAEMTIICTPAFGMKVELKIDGIPVKGALEDPSNNSISIEVTCQELDDTWLYGSMEVRKVSCSQDWASDQELDLLLPYVLKI